MRDEKTGWVFSCHPSRRTPALSPEGSKKETVPCPGILVLVGLVKSVETKIPQVSVTKVQQTFLSFSYYMSITHDRRSLQEGPRPTEALSSGKSVVTVAGGRKMSISTLTFNVFTQK